jgi:acetyl-CoA synthetase
MADADGAPLLRGPHLGRSAVDLVRFREALRELSLRTGQRSYLALVDGTQMVVADVVGKRGLPTIDGIRPTLAGQAHALAIGKAILAHADLAAVLEYLGLWGLPPYTASTITDGFAFMEELADIRRRGYAVDREEFQEGFCCVAAPVLDVDRSVVGAIGVSLSARRFEHERAEISEVVSQMAWWTSSRPDDALRAAVREVRRIPGEGPPQRRLRPSSDGRALLLPFGISRHNEWKEVRR